MIVCIAEKPSVAREIAAVLGATKKMDGYVCLGECYLEDGTTVYQYQPEEIANGTQPSQDPGSENIELSTSEALQLFPGRTDSVRKLLKLMM